MFSPSFVSALKIEFSCYCEDEFGTPDNNYHMVSLKLIIISMRSLKRDKLEQYVIV